MLKKILFILFLVSPLTNILFAQITIGKPTLFFTQACANPGFNEFGVGINFSASPSLDNNNQFIVELSDPMGNFAIPMELYRSEKGEITVTGTKVMVAIPTSSSGENYQIRVRSTQPSVTSPRSNVFAAYYKPHDTDFTINNSIPSASYCSGGSYILSIDPNGNGVINSPLVHSFLTYNWYRDNSTPTMTLPATLVASATSGTYSVSTPGVYFVETNYGTCTSGSYSNRVTVTASATNASATIVSSKGNPFCSSQGATILSTSAGQTYQWYKDDMAISGATSQTYAASVAAKYSVKVDYGGCQANASIALQVNTFNSSINIPETPNNSTTITPGESLTVTVTTDATNPKFQWYHNDVAISGANSANYSVALKGNYKVSVTQTGTCDGTNEHSFTVRYDSDPDPFPNVEKIPNLISPNGDFINDTWILPKEYVNGTNAEVMIISSNGKIVLQTTNYQNDWPSKEIEFKNINPVFYYIITTQDNKVKKGSITVIK